MGQNPHPDGYRFGVELEYRLTLKHDRYEYPGPQKVKDQLAKLWEDAGKGVEGHVLMKPSPAMAKAEDFKAWTIVDERSMDPAKYSLTFSFEFVSPIFNYKDGLIWTNQIKRLSDFILRHTIPEMDDTTGLHIHVSPVNGRWSLVDLKRIAQAIVYFDVPLKTLFPEHRYTEAFLKSNLRHNPNFSNLPPDKSAASLIIAAQTIDDLISIMNPPQGRNMRSQRNYAWNFTNNSDDASVCPKPKHTIEFRSPRSTTACELIEQWIVFTVTFLHGSVTGPENIHTDFAPNDVDGLNGFLYHNRPPGGTNDYCWAKRLSRDNIDRVLQGVGQNIAPDE